jgi:hypothetical protein
MSGVTQTSITQRQAPVSGVAVVMSLLRVFTLCGARRSGCGLLCARADRGRAGTAERALVHSDAMTLDDPVLCASAVDTFCLDADSAPDRYALTRA